MQTVPLLIRYYIEKSFYVKQKQSKFPYFEGFRF